MSKTEPLRTAPIDNFAVPRHVAIIMDGNGRWAAARGLPRGEGHRRGVEALRRTVRAAGDIGVGILTIFSFSSENWSRPPAEIRELMTLLRRFIRNDLADLHKSGVRVRVIGEREDLDPEIRNLLEEAESLTRDNDKLILVVAFNYGARAEIARAAQRMAAAVAAGDLRGQRGDRRQARELPRRAGPARPRSHHPHQRRAAAVQFPAVAGGLQRTGVRSDLLAGFRPLDARRRDRRIQPSRATVWRPDRAHRIVIVADAEPTKWTGAPLATRELVLRVLSALVLAPLAIAVAYVGGWPFVVFWGLAAAGVLWEWTSLVALADRRVVLMAGLAPLALAVALGGARTVSWPAPLSP